MDDQLLSMLGKALHSLESDASALDELIVPRAPSAGENAGVAAQRGKSRPPVVVSVLDVKIGVEAVLDHWVTHTRRELESARKDTPGGSLSEKAAWLNRFLPFLADMPWGEMMAQEVIGQARWVSDLVNPPASPDDPTPLESGGVREVVSWAVNLGAKVSKSSVYSWVKDGSLPSVTAPDGSVHVRLQDVMDKCRNLQVPGSGQAVC